MKLAIMTDMHGNLEAFEACLADAARARTMRYALLGDLVGYGADPQAVIDLARRITETSGFVIKGNHDAAASGDEATLGTMNQDAASAIRWTQKRLDNDSLCYLAALPMTIQEGDTLYVHADARSPESWGYLTGPSDAERALRSVTAKRVFCGHVHITTIYQMHKMRSAIPFKPSHGQSMHLIGSRLWLAVIGAVGQPRDGDPRATYGLFDTRTNSLTIRRVAYDVETAARKIRKAGLSPRLADRLFRGG